MSPLNALLIGYWAEAYPGTLEVDVLDEYLKRPTAWAHRINNHGRALLFSVRPRARGIDKYYCGWGTFVQLSAGNIRYLLALVREAIVSHVDTGTPLGEPISPSTQTNAAQSVALRTLLQLQGLAVEGADLTRLVLAIGRILGIMARNPHGHAPEVTQFRVQNLSLGGEANALLAAGTMHLAILRFPGNKMAAVSGETHAFDYQLHPIFAPFFVYSHRRKRRFNLTSEELLGLTSAPAVTIERVLARSGRSADPDIRAIPEQLTLFSEFYGG